MYEVCRCDVCGDVYLGVNKPDTCPFCGAHRHHLESLDVDDFSSIFPGERVRSDDSEDTNFLVDIGDEEFSEISEEVFEKVKKGAVDYGILEAYSIFAERVSDRAAERFFRGLEELEKQLKR